MSLCIDCDDCAVRGPACDDCVVTVLLGGPPDRGFDDDERRALDVLAGSGLVPPLRMVRPLRVADPGGLEAQDGRDAQAECDGADPQVGMWRSA